MRCALALLLAAAAAGAACDKNTTSATTSFPLQVTVSPTSASLTGVGQTVQFVALASGGDVGQAAQGVNWSSSNQAVATVDANGVVTATGAGTASIIATSKADPSKQGAGIVTVTLPSGVNLTPLYGTFAISATKTTDTGCNFNNSFAGQLQISGNNDGSGLTVRMIESLTRTYSGTMNSNGSFNVTGTGNLNGFVYNGTITGQVTGSSLQGTETMNFTAGCPGKMVVYNFSGNK